MNHIVTAVWCFPGWIYPKTGCATKQAGLNSSAPEVTGMQLCEHSIEHGCEERAHWPDRARDLAVAPTLTHGHDL